MFPVQKLHHARMPTMPECPPLLQTRLSPCRYKKDVSTDARALQKLRREAERAKRALSSQHQVRVEIESLVEGVDLSGESGVTAFDLDRTWPGVSRECSCAWWSVRLMYCLAWWSTAVVNGVGGSCLAWVSGVQTRCVLGWSLVVTPQTPYGTVSDLLVGGLRIHTAAAMHMATLHRCCLQSR